MREQLQRLRQPRVAMMAVIVAPPPAFENQVHESGCIGSWIADGWCDAENNLVECGYDGGDCCPSTCESSYYQCGDFPFDCIDPQACEVTGECEPAPSSGSGMSTRLV